MSHLLVCDIFKYTYTQLFLVQLIQYMATPKHFLQDRSTLLLVSIDTFLALSAIVLIALKLNATKGTVNYIISYRTSLGIDGYTQGTVWDVASFIAAALIILALGIVLGYRTYSIRRALSIAILTLTIPLLVLLIIVSNALLFLR